MATQQSKTHKTFRLKRDEWHNTHDKRWPPHLISKAAQDHPAKFAYNLVHRIYQHCASEGWTTQGDTVLDPFGGTALGALFAVTNGLNWFGVELEQEFVDAGYANIEAWEKLFGAMFHSYGRATLVCGDSRELAQHLQSDERPTLAVSSPPFLAQSGGVNVTSKHGPLSDPRAIHRARAGNSAARAYGATRGQLANMPVGVLRAVISSPPFSTSNGPRGGKHGRGTYDQTKGKGLERQKDDYSEYTSEGSLANIEGVTYWAAARAIVEQVYTALPSGGHACWVCKDYIRKGERVDFSGDWRKLCQSVGFVTLHRHDAVLVEHHGTQLGGIAQQQDKQRGTSHKSMFKRILEESGKIPPVNEEVVWCMLRP